MDIRLGILGSIKANNMMGCLTQAPADTAGFPHTINRVMCLHIPCIGMP